MHKTLFADLKAIVKAFCFGLAAEACVMGFAVVTGSYATPAFTSPLAETGFDIPGRLLHIPGHQFTFLLFGVLHGFDDWHLSWWSQLFCLFTFQAVCWAILWCAFLSFRSRRQRH